MSLSKRALLLKRKKHSIELFADNIDSTALHEKIIDDLQHKNTQAFIYYCNLLRQRKTVAGYPPNFHSVTPGHPLKKFDDNWDGQVSEGYFENFNYKSTMPKLISNLQNFDVSDPVTKLLEMKNNHFLGLRKMKYSAVNGHLAERYEVMNDVVVRCPKHFIDMAMEMHTDPDPYFNSSYNWYYSGNGNMHIICINWLDYILHSSLNKMYISEYNKNENSIASEPLIVFDCGDNILETIFSPLNVVTLRTKMKIIILKIDTSDNTFQTEVMMEVNTELAFTGVSFDSFHHNILYITSLNGEVKIVNLDRMLARTLHLQCHKKSLLNNWNTVIGIGRVNFAHVSNNSLTFYDKRTNAAVQTWSDVRNLTDEIDCNDITVAKYHEANSCLYFGTDHHFFQMDMRKMSKFKPNILQRWTHGMQCVPVYMSLCNFEFNKELICLSSQWCADTCLISNGVEIDKTYVVNGISMPYRLPSIKNTLFAANKKILCFDLYNPINKRLCSVVSGNVLVDQDEKFTVLLQNSLGDITSQILYPDYLEMFIEDNSPEALNEWSMNLTQPEKNFKVSSIINITPLWKQLKRIPNQFTVGLTLLPRYAKRFNQEHVFQTFENEDIEIGLLDIWTRDRDKTVDESCFLHFSDSE